MRGICPLVAIALVAGCGEAASPDNPPVTADAAGLWPTEPAGDSADVLATATAAAVAEGVGLSCLSGEYGGDVRELSALKNLKEIVVRPGDKIQAALKKAVPGTVIRVKAGTYREAVEIMGWKVKDARTTPKKPIILISDDGIGAATIKPPAGVTDRPTIFLRLKNTQIRGFRIIGAKQPTGDSAPLKIFSKGGNILIADNTILSTAEDVIKTGQTRGLTIVGNTLDTGVTPKWNSYVPEKGYLRDAGIDIVACKNINIQYNDWVGKYANGITMKGGTHDVHIAHNRLAGKFLGPAIKIGGRGTSRAGKKPWTGGLLGHEARNVIVRENVIAGQYLWNYVIQCVGGQHSRVEANLVAPTDTDAVHLYYLRQTTSAPYAGETSGWHHCKHMTFKNNILCGKFKSPLGRIAKTLKPKDGSRQDEGLVDVGNRRGTKADFTAAYGVKGWRSASHICP